MNYCPFKRFKNSLGVAGKGIHQFRLLDTAAFDYILTIVMAFLSSFILKVPLVLSTIGWFVLGVCLHILFGVKTNSIKYLGLRC